MCPVVHWESPRFSLYLMLMAAVHAEELELRITEACRRTGRPREDVTLIAVTKTLPPDVVNAALAAGIVDIGENRVQEYLGKRPLLAPHRFHMIGHLQRNKVRQIVGMCTLIHSVDSIDLADEIDRRSAGIGCVTPVLVEVNTSGEASKHGVEPDDASALVAHISGCAHLELRGFMTVAAFLDDLEAVRPMFRMLRVLRDRLQAAHPSLRLTELSMGMSHDFEVAIEEGATLIRVGTALFGARHAQ